MKHTYYYTVILCKTFFMVKYTIVPEGRILTFPGTFDSFAEAEEQFKKTVHGKLERFTEGTFQRKVSDMAARYQEDLAKLADWQSGKAVRI